MSSEIGIDSILELNSESDMDIQKHEVGDDRIPLLIVDNFLRYPENVREMAISLHYDDPLPGDYWPGTQAVTSIDRRALTWFIKRHFVNDMLGFDENELSFPYVRPGEVADGWTGFFQFTRFGLMTKTFAEAPWVNKPHVDEFAFLPSLIYLNHPAQYSGGTLICKHRETGIQCVPPYARDLPDTVRQSILGLQSTARCLEILECGTDAAARSNGPILSKHEHDSIVDRLMVSDAHQLGYMTSDNQDWIILKQVDMKFNRLVVYPSWQLHGVNWQPPETKVPKHEQRLTMMHWLNFPVRSK